MNAHDFTDVTEMAGEEISGEQLFRLANRYFWVRLNADGTVAEQRKHGERGLMTEQQIAEGFRYSFRHKGMAPLLTLLFISAVFARPFAELLPVARQQGCSSLAALQEHADFGGGCELCHPYVRRMLKTGETVFHEVITD